MLNKAIKQLKSRWEEDALYSRTVSTFVSGMWSRCQRSVIPIHRYAQDLSVVAFVILLSGYVLFPTMANADMELEQIQQDLETVQLVVASMINQSEPHGTFPVSADAPARREYTISITAYTSDVYQTDDTPCITASGLDVCERDIENVVAANFLPIGTRVRIPDLYGDRVFYVEDRMNSRYYYKMDVWLKDYQEAKAFGVQYATIEVF